MLSGKFFDMDAVSRRRISRPKLRWKEVVERNMRKAWGQRDDAQDRSVWRGKTHAADPTIMWHYLVPWW